MPTAAHGKQAGASPAQPAASATSADPQATPTDDAGVQDIVVTAQKRSENVQRVPIAIAVVPPQALQDAGVKSVQDLPVAVPGVQILNIAGQYTPRIRGIGSTFTSVGLESPVATFIDDVYRPFSPDIQLDFADVEQVAVLKGPQGTLFGRNATGGVLQVTTRQPSETFKGSVEGSIDEYATIRSNVYATGGIAPGTAASLSVSYAHQGNGYGRNLITGRDQYKLDHGFNIHGRVHADVGGRTRLDLSADYGDTVGNQSANYQIFPGRTGLGGVVPATSPWDSGRILDSRQAYKGGGLSLKASQDFGFATLTSISAYRDAHFAYQFAPTPTAELERETFVDMRSRQFTEELQLVSAAGNRFSWTIGGFYYHNDAALGYTTILGNLSLLAPPFQRFQSFPSHQITNSVAGYAQGTYKITPSTRLTAGVRYTHDVRNFSGQFLVGPSPNGPLIQLANVATLPLLNGGHNSFSKPTWRVSLDQDLAPGILGYVSYNRGIKSGGFNTTGVTNPPFQPEQLDAYEAGIKSQFLDNRVRLNVSGFYYDYQNIQVNIFSTGAPVILNAASARNYGADADLVVKATDALTLNASANWLHARFTRFPNAPSAVVIRSGPLTGGTSGIAVDASGNALPYSPDVTYALGATYDVRTRGGRLSFNVNDNYNSGFYAEPDNVLRQNAYHIVNTSVAWTPDDRRYTLRLFVNNVFDQAVASQMATAPWGYIVDYSNPPRVIGGSVKVNF